MQAIDDNFLTLAKCMADAAGVIARRYFRTSLTIDNKTDASPVTIADREIETALRAQIEAAYPDHGIIGEEFGNIRPGSPYQWVLDPIDGTRAFIAGEATFTTLIALAYEDVPILGVIDQPIMRERWVGVAGHPLDLAAARVKNNPDADTPLLDASLRWHDNLSEARIATTSMDYFTPQQLAAFQALKSRCAKNLLGGDAYAYAMLVCGNIDIVVDAGMKPYDFCALKTVVEGSGGVITDWHGQAITIKSDGKVIAAGNHALHEQALKILQKM